MIFHQDHGSWEKTPTIPDGIPSGGDICVFVLRGRCRIAELCPPMVISISPKFVCDTPTYIPTMIPVAIAVESRARLHSLQPGPSAHRRHIRHTPHRGWISSHFTFPILLARHGTPGHRNHSPFALGKSSTRLWIDVKVVMACRTASPSGVRVTATSASRGEPEGGI